MSDRERTEAFIAFMTREIPGFAIKFKDDPPETMPLKDRLLHAAARVINPHYDTRFTTVVYPIIYLPSGSRLIFEQRPERYYSTLRHEFIHLKDYQRYHVWFAVSYVALLPVVATMRAYWELRGYAQNLICTYERTGAVPTRDVERMAKLFAGREYVFMLWPHKVAHKHLMKIRAAILDGRLGGIYPYGPLDTPVPPGHTRAAELAEPARDD